MKTQSFDYRVICLLVAGIFLSLLASATPTQARNPNLSNWTINLSGDEPAGQKWQDYMHEIEVVGNIVHVLYWAQDDTTLETERQRLYYRRSLDGGQTWQAKQLLFDTEPGYRRFIDQTQKCLAVDGANVHIAYIRFSNSGYQVFYRRSLDNGATFEADRQLYPLEGGYGGPVEGIRIAASGGKVNLAYAQWAGSGAASKIISHYSTDNGSIFQWVEPFISGVDLHIYLWDLKRLGDKVHLLFSYQAEAPYDVMCNTPLACASSTTSGSSFSINVLSTASPTVGKHLTFALQSGSYSPNLALQGDNVYAIWGQGDGYYTDNNRSLYCRRSPDNGANWNTAVKLATNAVDVPGDLFFGQETLDVGGSNVFVVFQTTDGTLYLRRSLDAGASFAAVQELGSGSLYPVVRVDPTNNSKVYACWWNQYVASANAGNTFTSQVWLMPFESMVTGGTGTQMAVGTGDALHFAASLYYNTPAFGQGDQDIFYRRLTPAPNPSAGQKALQVYSDSNEARYDCLEVAHSPGISFSSTMTAEVWIKPQAGGADTGFSDEFRPALSKWLRSGGQSFNLGTYKGSGGRQARVDIRTADGVFSCSPAQGLVLDNLWYHLAFTYEAGAAGNNLKLYLNGRLVASTRATGNLVMDNGPFFAGYYGRWDLDEVRLWNLARTETEIFDNLSRPLTGTETGLAAYYNLNDTTKDITGHGNIGLLIYQESYVDSPVPRPIGSSMVPAINSLLLH